MATEKRKRQAKAYVNKRRAETYCASCGAQPIEWHREEHVTDHNSRIGPMMGRGCSIKAIAAEIDLCEPLCRRCHMELDGRMAALQKGYNLGRKFSKPSPCMRCGIICEKTWRGHCRSCYDKIRRGRI